MKNPISFHGARCNSVPGIVRDQSAPENAAAPIGAGGGSGVFEGEVGGLAEAFEGDGEIEFFFGNYSEYAEWLEQRRLDAGEGPESNSAKYRKMSL